MMTDPYVDYLESMKSARQFRIFSIDPQWVPGVGDIDGFIHDEVVRQMWNTRDPSGKLRIQWMKNAWRVAQEIAEERLPTVQDIITLGSLVEEEENRKGLRDHDIWVGNHKGPAPTYLYMLLDDLVSVLPQVQPCIGGGGLRPYTIGHFSQMVKEIETADSWYLAFEWMHPFGDGNGRTGKILHNWLLGTLDEPVLVADYFKGGNP